MNGISIVATVALSAVTVVADYCLKRASLDTNPFGGWMVAGAGVYGLSAIAWVYIFRHMTLAEVGVVYSVSVMLLLALTGVVFFGEKLRPSEYAGIACAIASVVLLKRFS